MGFSDVLGIGCGVGHCRWAVWHWWWADCHPGAGRVVRPGSADCPRYRLGDGRAECDARAVALSSA
ncbi:Uncharacterised protein [Chlamydia trachomatis]|nr:Uncharacterised protein [Chlamydia trachomatis]